MKSMKETDRFVESVKMGASSRRHHIDSGSPGRTPESAACNPRIVIVPTWYVAGRGETRELRREPKGTRGAWIQLPRTRRSMVSPSTREKSVRAFEDDRESTVKLNRLCADEGKGIKMV